MADARNGNGRNPSCHTEDRNSYILAQKAAGLSDFRADDREGTALRQPPPTHTKIRKNQPRLSRSDRAASWCSFAGAGLLTSLA